MTVVASRYPSGTTMLLVGTRAGLFRVTSQDRRRWTIEEPALPGKNVYYAMLDDRPNGGGRMFAADNGMFFGSFLRYSDDLGETWLEPARGIKFPEESGLALKNVWTIVPGRADEPGTVYAGVDPASLWESRDGGITWEINAGLAEHPTRSQWNPGNGGLCLHTILLDPLNARRMWVGISAVGCLRTEDGGKSWAFMNRNVRADFQPEKYPEFGQCVHRMVQHPTNPDVIFQQNHCGVYRTENGGEYWTEIRGNLPSDFGFPIALDPHRPDTIFVVSERFEGENGRYNVGDQFTVYRTQNGGESWESMTRGLPGGPGVRLGVLRHGMCTDGQDPCGIYVGTTSGQLFCSNDRGDSWSTIASYLPRINSVTATVLP